MDGIRRLAGIAAATMCATLFYCGDLYRSVNSWRARPSLNTARTWCYQLIALEAGSLAKSNCDVIVVYPFDAGHRAISRREIAGLKQKRSGGRRIVLAYLSVGEAEAYRDYWKVDWLTDPPWWLGNRNPAWRGAYRVRYWASEWQDQLFRASDSRLAAILDAGFDGAFLDNVDVYTVFASEVQDAQKRMVSLVAELASVARERRADALIVPQNGEELLEIPQYLATIDGMAKEDLLYGINGDGIVNSQADIDHSIALLQKVRGAGKPVLVVEYLAAANAIVPARAKLTALGFIPLFAERLLDRDPASPKNREALPNETSQGSRPPK